MTYSGSSGKKVELLVAEDSDYDFQILQKSLERVGPDLKVFRFFDGNELYSYLDQESVKPLEKSKKLILLDLNMPCKGGRDFLNELREHPSKEIRDLPVIIVTTSMYEEDLKAVMLAGISDFIIKSDQLEGVDQFCADVQRHIKLLCA